MRTSATQYTPHPLKNLPIIRSPQGKVKLAFPVYTPPFMARCPLCTERSAKRFCPAKQTSICAVCCGTKREVEIDCPSSCVYLKASRSYDAEKPIPDPEVAARVNNFSSRFLE